MSDIELSRRINVLVPNPTILEYGEQAVILMDPDRPVWLKTSSTGRWIFEQLTGNVLTVKELITKTAGYFSLPEDAVMEPVTDLLRNLEEDGFVRYGESTAVQDSIKTLKYPPAKSSLLPDDLPQVGLVSVWFTILTQCNLSCRHCYAPNPEGSKPISLDRSIKVLDILATIGVKRLYISGGEPLIHPHLINIVRHARAASSWKIFVVTNGFTDDYELIEELVGMVDYFQISIDGINADTHNSIRGPNSFEKATKLFAVVNGANKRSKTAISFTPLPENVDQLPNLYTFAVELQADCVYVTKPKKPARNQSLQGESFDEFLSEGFRRKIMDKYDEMVKSYIKFSQEVSTLAGVKIPTIDPSFDSALNLLLCVKRGCCSAGGNNLFIDEQGDCYPCVALNQSEHKLGNIFEEPFETIYNERAVQKFRQRIHVDRIDECRECPFKYFCAGDCRALGNDVREKSPYCALIKERYGRFLKLVRSPHPQ